MGTRPLWTCPRCGRGFANRNQTHSCGGGGDLDAHLAGKDPEVVAIFRRLVELAERNGPVTVLAEKSRIAFQVRMSFAAVTLRRRWVDGHVVLARRLDDPRFRRVESFSPRNHVHHFRLARLREVDDRVAAWLAEAYAVGEQRHLRRR
ncbi:MAG TPA: DUF5655 domain-containing protein [Actinomycetota bacterium]|jgi:hypothetical protein|nr:DUF5655 domain-containing protein [Actinomycetota bacterium]